MNMGGKKGETSTPLSITNSCFLEILGLFLFSLGKHIQIQTLASNIKKFMEEFYSTCFTESSQAL